MNIYGYIRVSSKDQNIARQICALEKIGIKKENMYIDKCSGTNFERPTYKKIIRKIKREDVLIIKSIDRLGRNYDEIIEQWHLITKIKKAHIQVIDMPLLNTNNNTLDVTNTFIADLVLQILSYVSHAERDNIKQRQAEGIKIALEKGIKFGRKPKETPSNFKEIALKYKKGNITSRQGAVLVGISQQTFLRWIKERI